MGTNLRAMNADDKWIVDSATGQVVGVQTAGQAKMLAVADAYPVGGKVDPVTGGSTLFPLDCAIDQNGELSRFGSYDAKPNCLSARLFSSRRSIIEAGAMTFNANVNTGGSVSVTTDSAVQFRGRPTVKAAVTGGSGTNFEIGISSATFSVPTDARTVETAGFVLALKKPAGATLGASALLYFTQDAYSTFKSLGAPNDYLHAHTAPDGWTYLYFDPSFSGLTGGTATINYSSATQLKLRITVASAGQQAGDWYIGGVFVLPATLVPKVFLTVDDGYVDWHNYLLPACLERGIPVTMALDKAYVGTSNYMTEAQWQYWINHPSRLFEAVNHGKSNQSFGTVGLAQYMANVAETDAYMAGIGVPERSRKLHVYVQGSYDTTLIAALKAAGYKAARDTSAYDVSTRGVMAALQSDGMYYLRACANLGNSTTVAQAIAAIESAKTQPNAMTCIMGHRFLASASDSITWIAGYDQAYGMSNYLDYLADQKDAGSITMPSLSRVAEGVWLTGQRLI